MKRRDVLAGLTGAALAASLPVHAQPATRKNYDFIQVDVFTHTPLEGNPLAVFPAADGMSDALMQNIARELNHSETTFIQSARNGGDARVRIFSQNSEQKLPLKNIPSTAAKATSLSAKEPFCIQRKAHSAFFFTAGTVSMA